MMVDNTNYYGHLLNTDDYDTKQVHPDLFQIFDNRLVSIVLLPYS